MSDEAAMEAPLSIEQHRLVKRSLPLVERCARRVLLRFSGLIAFDDLCSEGKLGLYAAVRLFDEALGPSFETYAQKRVEGAMYRAVACETRNDRVRRAALRAMACHLSYYHDDFNVLQHQDTELERRFHQFSESLLASAFAAGIEEIAREVARDRLAEHEEEARAVAALKKLPPDEYQVIVLIYYEGRTLNEVAALLGLREKKTPWRRCQRALKRLRDELGAP